MVIGGRLIGIGNAGADLKACRAWNGEWWEDTILLVHIGSTKLSQFGTKVDGARLRLSLDVAGVDVWHA